MSFPTIVYKCPGAHACAGGTYAYQGVQDKDELDLALSGGWFATLSEAIAGEHDEADDNSAPTRVELEEEAAALGIKFDGRTTDKSLADKIEAALKEQE
jgi:hypothetical protein